MCEHAIVKKVAMSHKGKSIKELHIIQQLYDILNDCKQHGTQSNLST